MNDHRPDTPFGCVTSWGADVGGRGGIHICNHDDGHKGKHQCKCGETFGGEADRG